MGRGKTGPQSPSSFWLALLLTHFSLSIFFSFKVSFLWQETHINMKSWTLFTCFDGKEPFGFGNVLMLVLTWFIVNYNSAVIKQTRICPDSPSYSKRSPFQSCLHKFMTLSVILISSDPRTAAYLTSYVSDVRAVSMLIGFCNIASCENFELAQTSKVSHQTHLLHRFAFLHSLCM